LGTQEQHTKFAAVVTPHLADAYTLARWLTHSRADADDVLQEACIRALGAIEQHSGTNSRAWVLAIQLPRLIRVRDDCVTGKTAEA
jgi:RNA polymerase sigma-70 factor (ECF subfamily)